MCLNAAVFKVFICGDRKLPFLCLNHPLFQHLHMNPTWTAMRHSQMVNVAKHALSSNVFLRLFTQAWRLMIAWIHFCSEYRTSTRTGEDHKVKYGLFQQLKQPVVQCCPSYKLISHFMPVLVIYKFNKDLVKTKWAMLWTSSNSGFFSTRGQVTLRLIVGSGQISNTSKVLWLSYLFASFIMIW